MDHEAAIDAADQRRKADKENGPLTPLNEAARQAMAKHVCRNYTIRDERTVCVYCGKEMEL